MSPESRPPPPKVLFVHNGEPYHRHIKHLTDSGLRVTEAHAETALTEGLKLQPDIVVLDFGCDGEITAQFKADGRTKHIPVIALVDLMR